MTQKKLSLAHDEDAMFWKKIIQTINISLIIVISVEVYLEFITFNHNENCRDAFDGKATRQWEEKGCEITLKGL